MSAPRVSILLPAWNAAATIGAALASSSRQSLRDWECIVVDDGSTDGTPEIVEALAAPDPRIALLRRPHQGLVNTLNAGLARCRAPLVARMDADDVMHRHRLARQVEALDADPSLAAVGCHVRVFGRGGVSARAREYETWLNSLTTANEVRRDAFVECPVAHPTLMMRRVMADLAYQDSGWPEDYDLILRALGQGLRIGMVARRLLSWRRRENSLSRTDARYAIDRFTACKAHYLAHGFLAADDTYVLWGYGATGKTLRLALTNHGKQPSQIIEVKASRVGQRIHGAEVVPIAALPSLRGRKIVVSVARAGPRREIREALGSLGFVDGRDYVCAA